MPKPKRSYMMFPFLPTNVSLCQGSTQPDLLPSSHCALLVYPHREGSGFSATQCPGKAFIPQNLVAGAVCVANSPPFPYPAHLLFPGGKPAVVSLLWFGHGFQDKEEDRRHCPTFFQPQFHATILGQAFGEGEARARWRRMEVWVPPSLLTLISANLPPTP